jgi:Raf kinase inhibitor-like YbhB/YbcL family protein
MKKISLLFALIFVSCSTNQAFSGEAFEIKSADIKAGSTITNQHVFDGFGCSGKNISPQISWKNAPQQTKSFALTVYDPDAPTGSGWWHYVALNIPATYSQLPKNFGAENKFKINDGILQIQNDFSAYKFGGPCPPKGDKAHRYIFTIYALKSEKIEVPQTATAALAGYMINQNVLAKSSFEAFFGR